MQITFDRRYQRQLTEPTGTKPVTNWITAVLYSVDIVSFLCHRIQILGKCERYYQIHFSVIAPK